MVRGGQVSCIPNKHSKKAGRAFCVTTALFLLLALAMFVFGLMHRSDHPEILGRYSFSYGLLLLGLLATVGYIYLVLWLARPPLKTMKAKLYFVQLAPQV